MTVSLTEKISVFNENKLLILQVLYKCKDDTVCGCDLIDKLEIPKNLLSYHLKSLSQLGYIEEKRCGRKKNYRIKDLSREKVKKILEVTELI